jgi:ketosteroid isomerase-like protein
MQILLKLALILFLASHAGITRASDACSNRAIVTTADVTVSDGTAFRTESFFHARDETAIRHIRDSDQIVAIEGPLSWVRVNEKSQLGAGFHKLFALGHQYHAFLLHFDELSDNLRETKRVIFGGNVHRARSGDYPYGGTVHLIEGTESSHPVGLVFEFPESAAIQVTFSDWRKAGATELPFRAEIDDGERTFDYRYSNIEISPGSPLWFHETVSAPTLDQIQVYRLHRKLLAAHCLGDAEMLSKLSAEEIVSASKGELVRAPNDSIRERFTALFERLDYSEYHDIEMPIIEIAESSDLGWIGANVRAVGSNRDTGELFDNQWAWFMIVRKVDGHWLHAGNASNVGR